MNTDYILNPNTHRKCKIGGRVYNKLIHDNILKIDKNTNKKVLFILENENDDINTAKKIIKENFTEKQYTVQKGRKDSIYKNTIVKKRKIMGKKDFIDNLSLIIYKIINEDEIFLDNLRSLEFNELKKTISIMLLKK